MKRDKVLIIAEAGVNHNGSLENAKKLIDVASKAGADMVKFQTFSADRLVKTSTSKAEYQIQNTFDSESQHAMLSKLELSFEMHEELIEYCNKCCIEFFSTGFDIKSIEKLVKLGLRKLKIPSGEITNLPYLRHIGKYAKPIIISTGMANLAEIKTAVEILSNYGTPKEKIVVLHCNTEYPTPMNDVNLNAMLTIRDELDVKVGYSDHTLGIEIPIAAASLGAVVIEKHFTLSRKLEGPDHRSSLEPDELIAMVKAVRNIEEAMGDGEKKPSKSETKNIPIVRKSIVALQRIKIGEVFTDKNISTKRPGTGISPMKWDDFIGKTANREYQPDELIKY